jgi:hypothetical protein
MSASLHGAIFRPVSLRQHAHENGFSGVEAGAARASLTIRIAAGDKSKKTSLHHADGQEDGVGHRCPAGAVIRSHGEMVPDA